MKKMTKFLLTIVSVLAITAGTLGMASCGETTPPTSSTQAGEDCKHTLDEMGECTICHTFVGVTEGIEYDFSLDGTYAEVFGYEGTATNIRIADIYQGVPVKTIGLAFYDNDNITSVIIPNSVTTIGYMAFAYCDNLTSVVIGDSVTKLEPYAFASCSQLTSVVIGDSVTYIDALAFRACPFYCS